jgi:hypothetical protein
VIGQNNQLNIYYQSEILSSPHRITAYGSAQPIQTLFVADEVLPLVIFVHRTVKPGLKASAKRVTTIK